MNSRELVIHAILGSPIERCPCGPLAVHYTARLAGVTLRDYTLDAKKLAACVLHYYEKLHPDAVWLSADTWVAAEAMGATVGFMSDDQPMCGIGAPRIKSFMDITRIPQPNPSRQGRLPIMCEALAIVKEQLGDKVFIVGCFDQSPFSLAAALMGVEELMIKVVDRPDFVQELLERCIEHAVAYALALAGAGADMLSTGDSVAGLVGRDIYTKIALPAERRVFEDIRAGCDALLSLHICGDTSHILADMATAGADVLEIDSSVDIADAIRLVGPEIALWGNIDPVAVLAHGTPEQVRLDASRVINTVRAHARTRFVLSSGCTLAPDTPEENVRALINAAAESVANQC